MKQGQKQASTKNASQKKKIPMRKVSQKVPMASPPKTVISDPLILYDNNHKIIYSGTFNVYENKLTIERIAGFKILFNFPPQENTKESEVKISGNNTKKELTITVPNFHRTLGVGTTNKIPILLQDNGRILFSIYGQSLGKDTDLLRVTLTFYFSSEENG